MKIGLFTDAYFPSVSGVVTSVLMLENGLKELGHEVYIITMDNALAKDTFSHIIRFKGLSYPKKNLKEYKFNFFVRKHIKTIKKLNLDIIHVHTEFTIGRLARLASKKLKIPMVYTMHTMYEDYFFHIAKHGKKLFYKLYMKFVLNGLKKYINHANYVILPTQKVLDKVEKYQIHSDKFNIIPTGLDLDKFNKKNFPQSMIDDLKKQYQIKEKKVLLYIGRISKEKSLHIIIQEFIKINQDVHLVIVGDGPELENIKKLVHDLSISNKIIFTGMVEWDKIGLYYQLGDIFVNASTTETQGLTYIEALAAQLPLVVKYDDSIKSLGTDYHNGLFFYEDSDFSKKIDELLENAELFNKLCENSIKSVEIYSKLCYANNVLQLYEKSLNNKPAWRNR